ncbi:unnamed protein product [Effrenium voratum]|uniref:P-type ATPase A domain-containing protein n=1 Tax=Effrenium voratum TaxID=2562239 RepID=A0AA36IA82_9DINO|nr:unnamed protein product [Effrenium voratum]
MGGLVDETAHRGLIVTFLEFPCLVVYTYAAGAFALYFFWTCRQSVQNTLVLRNAAIKKQDDLGQACVQCITDSQNRVIEFEGYKYSRLGRLVSLLVPLNTAALLTLFVVVLFDYYYGCLWEWPDHLCYVGTFPLFGSFDTNSYVFLLIWCLGVAWFFLLIDNSGGQSVKLFGLRAPFRKATVICVYVEERQETISSGYSRTLALRKYLLKVAMKVLRRKELPGGFLSLSGTSSQTLPLKYDSVSNMHYVEFRCQRYIYDSENDGFTQHDPSSSLRKGQDAFTELQQGGGLRSRGTSSPGNFPTVEEMYRSAGPNQIPFEVDSWTQALTEEFCTFFFLYQFAIYAVCAWFSYWHYTIIAVSIAVSSGFFNASVRLASQKSIKSMMEQNLKTRVLRDGQVMEVDAGDLVPGDVVKVESGPVPCDLLLLKGAAVCDESTLTGESMPVQRLAPVERLPDDPPGMRFPTKHVLVAGTTVLQAVDDDTWALATHTGIHTQKGQLLLLILYPPKLIFKYDEQLSVVFFLLIAYALLISVTLMRVMYMRYAQDQKLPLTATWASAVFTCSCVLPTMLHIVLSVGQVMSAQRLRDESSIFCVVPKRIALAGKVRVACFDKTGTLTTSGLEFFGVHCLQSSGKGSGPFSSGRVQGNGTAPSLEDAPRPGDWDLEVLCGLACAHSLSPFAGTETGVVGNAVEVNMFQASGWTLSSATRVQGAFANQPHEVEITKRFDFSHSTMTMSAIVQHKPSKERGVYVKGSFEHVLRLCRPESVPENFPQVAAAHAYSGMYVLALAARPLKAEEKVETRAEAEKGLSLLGLLLFKNPPRSDTKDTIASLRQGDVRSVMITGDAAGTAISIAKEIELAVPGLPVLLGDLETDSQGKSIVCWRCTGDDLKGLNEILLGNEWLNWRKNYKQWRGGGASGARGEATVKAATNRAQEAQELELSRRMTWSHKAELEAQGPQEEVTDQDYVFSTEEIVLSRLYEWCELAVTQRAFEWLAAQQCSPDLRRVLLGSRLSSLKKGKALGSGKGSTSLLWELLTCIRIFARMTPNGKISVVEGFMSQNLMCAMVGDGGNDSGALRTAHVGMALSSATSATVVAPFTTNRPSVAPIADLLREGRGALATSFAGYKYCIHYGLLNSVLKFKTYWYGIAQSMAAAYFQDLLGFLSLSWAISLARPAPSLSSNRPTSSLFSGFTVFSVMGMLLLNSFFLEVAWAYITSQEEYTPFPVHKVRITQWWKLNTNWEVTTLFFSYTFQLFWSAVVYSFGDVFRLAWHRNLLKVLVSVSLGFLTYLMLSGPTSLTRFFRLVFEDITDSDPWTEHEYCPAMPRKVRLHLLCVIMINLACTAFLEKVIIQGRVGDFMRVLGRALSKHVTLRL